MKYQELIQFEPIEEVIKFNQLDNSDYRQSLVRNFVFSETYEKYIIPEICRQLDYTSSSETFGLQIVGDFGTGKSHLMSLFSLVAEDASLLEVVRSESARRNLGVIAGKYKIVRFEMGSTDELWKIVCEQIDKALATWGIIYSIAADSKEMYKDRLNRMMAQFEEAFPGKGMMIVIDEMLEYLKGRASDDKLNRDLGVLRALGELSDRTKFRMVFGVQEQIYNVPQFQFAADMLNHANDRFRQITITKQDVQFVVQERLLHKTEQQKAVIRRHLSQFTEFFTDMHAKLEDYVNLYPVHPSFFENFQQIKIAKSQREVMKTLTKKFKSMLTEDVPANQPGLICYDHYWDDLNIPSMMTEPDIKRVSEIMATVHQKIDDNFTGARAKKAILAHRIANACAIKILQDSLERTNGASAENLIDDLCHLDAGCLDREFLLDTIGTVAQQIVTATVGQYFEKNETNQEYHLRIEGGVNYEQKIKDYVGNMNADRKDQHFFSFLVEYMPIVVEQYRREFKIYRHSIDWKSHKTKLDGYIFMGNPTERSTTQPQQNFYIYFMPIFNQAKLQHGDEPDSIYVHLDKVSDELKQTLELYASAEELMASVDSSQKPLYKVYKDKYVGELKRIFQRDFMQCTEIYYQGEKQNITPQMMTGGSKEQIISNIASTLLEDYFCAQWPDHPKFTLLSTPLTDQNRAGMLRAARTKIAKPTEATREGEAILAGLGLLHENQLSAEGSIYAISLLDRLAQKGEGQVLNRDEILYQFFKEWDNDWRSCDYHIAADLEFLVLATLVALGEIEIDMPGGKNINAANISEIVTLAPESFYAFSHIRKPKDINLKAVRELFMGFLGKDLTAQLQNQEIYAQLLAQAKIVASRAVAMGHKVGRGIFVEGVEVMSPMDGTSLSAKLSGLAGLCDKLPSYASPAKMRNLPWSADDIQKKCALIREMDRVNKLLSVAGDFASRISYLNQAMQYMVSDEMKQRTQAAIAKLQDIVNVMDNEAKVKAYQTELDQLMGAYADWYMAEYKRLHITNLQDAEKRLLMQDNQKHVCDDICNADHQTGYFAASVQYADWCRRIGSLTPCSSSVTREAVLRTPYQGFNPVQYAGKQLPDLGALKAELQEIFTNIDSTLHTTLADPELLKNSDILDPSERSLLDRFNAGDEELSPMNAERLMEIVGKLHRGITKITISANEIRSALNRPMTPDEAIRALRKCIEQATGGNRGENIRIIFK